MRNRKGEETEGRRSGQGLGPAEGRKTVIWIYYMRTKKNLFSAKGKILGGGGRRGRGGGGGGEETDEETWKLQGAENGE